MIETSIVHQIGALALPHTRGHLQEVAVDQPAMLLVVARGKLQMKHGEIVDDEVHVDGRLLRNLALRLISDVDFELSK